MITSRRITRTSLNAKGALYNIITSCHKYIPKLWRFPLNWALGLWVQSPELLAVSPLYQKDLYISQTEFTASCAFSQPKEHFPPPTLPRPTSFNPSALIQSLSQVGRTHGGPTLKVKGHSKLAPPGAKAHTRHHTVTEVPVVTAACNIHGQIKNSTLLALRSH